MGNAFMDNDRVQLIADFNNEPGIIPAGTHGTVTHVSDYYVHVRFDSVSDLQDHAKINNEVVGLPMYPQEVERL